MRRSTRLLTLLAATAAAAASLALPTSAVQAAAPAPTATAGAAASTKAVYVRPVTTEGRPAPGWTVKRESGSVDCSGTAPSAVNPGIVGCYPSAYGFRACWKSQRHTVLCVRDARVKSLVRVHYNGTYPRVEAQPEPTPIDLVLSDGRICLLRVGGAWGSPAQHPQWVGFDSCSRNASVYGPGLSGDGINRTDDTWSVRLWRHDADAAGEHLVKRTVTKVYYVGTAAA